MERRPSYFLWFALLGILILPTAAGRFFLDLAGGLMLAFLAIPLFLSGLAWIGWKVLQSRMITCQACGLSTFSSSVKCPVCGSFLDNQQGSNKNTADITDTHPASSVTIDITASDPGNDK